jgi:DNA-binding NarL/FixJ family response regulator
LTQTRILLADDNPAVLEHVRSMLENGYVIVGEFRDGESVLREYDKLKPDVIILDISMGRTSGIDVARRLRDTGCLAKVVFLTVHDDQEFVSAALGAGGSAYVVKSAMGTDLISAVQAALEGRLFVSSSTRN